MRGVLVGWDCGNRRKHSDLDRIRWHVGASNDDRARD
jgi:hypothetical protein